MNDNDSALQQRNQKRKKNEKNKNIRLCIVTSATSTQNSTILWNPIWNENYLGRILLVIYYFK